MDRGHLQSLLGRTEGSSRMDLRLRHGTQDEEYEIDSVVLPHKNCDEEVCDNDNSYLFRSIAMNSIQYEDRHVGNEGHGE